jgi:hypothetical protein
MFITPKYASDNSRNHIDLSTSDEIDLDALLTHADPSKRLYPITGLKNVTITPTDPKMKTYDDDSKTKVTNGIYTFMGNLVENGASAPLVSQLNNTDCDEWAVYFISTDGAVSAQVDAENAKLYPIDWTGFFAQGLFASAEQGQEIKIQFDLDSQFDFGKLYQVPATQFSMNPLDSKGVIPVTVTFKNGSPAGSTGVSASSIEFRHPYGEGKIGNNITGLVATDILLKNVTANATVPILTVTESVGNHYNITYTTQTITDVLEAKINLTTTRMEGSNTAIMI